MPRKEPMMLPLLEIIYLPGDPLPMMITLEADFDLTGEVHYRDLYTTDQLREVQKLLFFIWNDIADTIWERLVHSSPPFEPTGRLSPDGEQPTE